MNSDPHSSISNVARKQTVLDESRPVFRNAIYRRLQTRTWDQWKYAGVANAEIRGPIYTQLRVDNTSHLAGKHGTRPDIMVRTDGSFLDKSKRNIVS